jgi:hypothetical protein
MAGGAMVQQMTGMMGASAPVDQTEPRRRFTGPANCLCQYASTMELPGDKGTLYWHNWSAGACTPAGVLCPWSAICNTLCCGSRGWWHTGNSNSACLGPNGNYASFTVKDPVWAPKAPLRVAFEGALAASPEVATAMAPYRRWHPQMYGAEHDTRFKTAPAVAKALNEGWCKNINEGMLHAKGYTCKAYHDMEKMVGTSDDVVFAFYLGVVRHDTQAVPQPVTAQTMVRSEVGAAAAATALASPQLEMALAAPAGANC